MADLQIKTGAVKINILDDDGEIRGVFSFNPSDIGQWQRLSQLIEEFGAKEKEFTEKEKDCETVKDKLNLLNEIVDYFLETIDGIYGQGTHQILFGNAKTLEMVGDFFEGITPYYQKESKKRIAKYKK